MMKRTICLLLSLLLVVSLAGCTPKEVVQNTPEVTESVTPEVTPVEEVEVTPEPTATPEPTKTPAEMIGDLSMKEMFAERGMKVGTCLTTTMINDSEINNLLLTQYSSITMENAMKPDATFDRVKSVESGEIEITLGSEAIKMLDWARDNGMAVRGHTIVWYSQTPDWIFYENFDKNQGLVSRDTMLKRLESAMKNTFGTLEELGYADLFYAYDVVNEYWMEDGTMRQNKWMETIGEDYVWYALYYARQYAPENIDLYINDYNEQYKSSSVVKFLDTLVDDEGNYLMDGIGLQAHLYTSDNVNTYLQTVDKLASTGLKLEITELDVGLGAYQKQELAIDENLKKQGKYYYNLFKGLFDRIDAGTLKMDSVTLWGVSDKYSWRSEYNPLLFNKKNAPKYAFFGIMQDIDRAGFR